VYRQYSTKHTHAAYKGTEHNYQKIKGKEELTEATMIKGGVVSITIPCWLHVYVVLLQYWINYCSYCTIIKNCELIETLAKAVVTHFNYYPSTGMRTFR